MAEQKLTVLEEVWLLVGQFMYFFSQIEDALNEAIRRGLVLNPATYELVTTNLDFAKKVGVVRALISTPNERLTDEKREGMDKALKRSLGFNTDRITVAHYPFEPAETGKDGVVFLHTKAKEKLKRENIHWTKAEFEHKIAGMLQNSLDIQNMLYDLAGYDWSQMPDRRMAAFVAAVSQASEQNTK